MANVGIIPDGGRRRRWSASEKLRSVEETLEDHASISIVARRNGVAPNLLYRWRRLMLEGGSVAVTEDDDVTSNGVVRELDSRISALRAPSVIEVLTDNGSSMGQKLMHGLSHCMSR